MSRTHGPWTEEHTKAVDVLKEDICSYPCLMNVDNTKPYQVRVDACRKGHGIGGVLLQPDEEGEWRPVSWWSRSLSPAEKEYSSTELECKALHDIILYYIMTSICKGYSLTYLQIMQP